MGGGGRARGPQPTKPVIKPTKKMKGFFWKRIIVDPNSKDDTMWNNIKEVPMDQADIEEHFHDKRAGGGGEQSKSDVIVVTGPQKKCYFSAEESKQI